MMISFDDDNPFPNMMSNPLIPTVKRIFNQRRKNHQPLQIWSRMLKPRTIQWRFPRNFYVSSATQSSMMQSLYFVVQPHVAMNASELLWLNQMTINVLFVMLKECLLTLWFLVLNSENKWSLFWTRLILCGKNLPKSLLPWISRNFEKNPTAQDILQGILQEIKKTTLQRLLKILRPKKTQNFQLNHLQTRLENKLSIKGILTFFSCNGNQLIMSLLSIVPWLMNRNLHSNNKKSNQVIN